MSKASKNVNINLKVDAPGLKEVGGAVEKITTGTVDGALGFLRSICIPAAEQFGKVLEDKVKEWRYFNFLRFVEKTQNLHESKNIDPSYHINPRVMIEIGEEVSKQDDDVLQSWWAGITVSACEEEATDEQLIFVDLMKKITRMQAMILAYGCSKVKVVHSPHKKLIVSKKLIVTEEELEKITGVDDFHRLDRELDALNTIGLLTTDGGFNIGKKAFKINITPSSLALHFYARCQGESKNINNFYSSVVMDKTSVFLRGL